MIVGAIATTWIGITLTLGLDGLSSPIVGGGFPGLMNFLIRGSMIGPEQAEKASKIPRTVCLLEGFRLPRLALTRLHLGILIAVILAFLVYFLWGTTLGYRIRAVGQNIFASRYTGIKVNRHIVTISLL